MIYSPLNTQSNNAAIHTERSRPPKPHMAARGCWEFPDSWILTTKIRSCLWQILFRCRVVLLSVLRGSSSPARLWSQELRRVWTLSSGRRGLCPCGGGLIFKSLWIRRFALITRPVYSPVSTGQGTFDQLQINWPVREIFNVCDPSWILFSAPGSFFCSAFFIFSKNLLCCIPFQLVKESLQKFSLPR